jgi:hypothetical protein
MIKAASPSTCNAQAVGEREKAERMTDLIGFILAQPGPTASLLSQLAHRLLKPLSRARDAGESLAYSLSRQVRDYL